MFVRRAEKLQQHILNGAHLQEQGTLSRALYNCNKAGCNPLYPIKWNCFFFLYGSLWGWDWPVGDESGVGQWDKYGLLSFFVLLAGNLAFGHEHSQELGKGNMEAA